jgi:hypothetical protein
VKLYGRVSRSPSRPAIFSHNFGLYGAGKSTTTFAWVQSLVHTTGKSVTWFHVNSTNLVHRVDFKCESREVSYMAPNLISIDNLQTSIVECTSAVLVLDGAKGTDIFKNRLLPEVRLWAGKKKGERTAVLVSSGAVPEARIEDVSSEIINMVFQNWSWTLEEYVSAFKYARSGSNFGARVTKKRKVETTSGAVVGETILCDGIMADIDDKYFYAGGCARYFFGFSTQQVKKSISDAVNSLSKTNIADVLNTGASHEETRHRLISFFRPNENGDASKSIVSQFAVQQLVQFHGESAFVFLYGLGATNPAFDGWVFEADFFFQCNKALEKSIPLPLLGEPGFELKPRSIFKFNHDDMRDKAKHLSESDSEDKLKQDTIKSELREMVSRRCKPTKWNQGGYDGFDVSAKDISADNISIDFFQVTRGASHQLNLKYFVEVVKLFIDAGFDVYSCEIYFVVPEGQTTSISKVTPYGNLFRENFGWLNGKEKEKIRVVTLKKTTFVTTP